MSTEAVPEPAAEPRRGAWSLEALASIVLLGAYFASRVLFPREGEAEFAYAPYTPMFHWFAPMRGFTVEQLCDHALRFFVLGSGLLLLSRSLARASWRVDWAALFRRRPHVPASVLSLLVTAFVMLVVVRGRPIVDDEVTYANMARLFARGRLVEPGYPGFVPRLFDIVTPAGVTGKYLPGEPLLQVLGVLVGNPALVHLPLNALTLFAFYRALRLLWPDVRIASWSTAFLALSPMFILCASTGHSQASALACTAVAVLGYALAAERSLVRGGVLAGCAVGCGMVIRPQAVPVVGLVLALAFTYLAGRRRAFAAWLAYAACSMLGVLTIALYDRALSGGTFAFPFWFMRSTEQWGADPFPGYVHTLRGALHNQIVVAARLNAWWIGWPMSLLLLAMPSAWRGLWTHARVLCGLAIAVVLFQLGYYTTGVSDVGPIYHYELLLLLSVLLANFLLDLSQREVSFAACLLGVHLVLGTGSFLIEQTARLHRLVEAIHGESDRVLASLPRPSLLLTETGCSEMLFAGWLLRGYPLEVRDPKAPVVITLRPDPAQLDALVAHFPGRACFYTRANVAERRLEVLPCAEARPLLSRPVALPAPCNFPPSTAARLGWYDLGRAF